MMEFILAFIEIKNLGIAFEKLQNNLIYYPTVELGFCGSKIQINNDVDFPDF